MLAPCSNSSIHVGDGEIEGQKRKEERMYARERERSESARERTCLAVNTLYFPLSMLANGCCNLNSVRFSAYTHGIKPNTTKGAHTTGAATVFAT